MVKEQIRRVTNWEELLNLVENTNTFKETIVLSGYVNFIDEDRLKITEILFTIKSLDVLTKKKKVKKDDKVGK